MRSAYKHLFLLLSLLASIAFNNLLAAESDKNQDFERGRQAYLAKDYELARQTLKPLAEAGHAEAQLYMGIIYDVGLGVERDPELAIYWLVRSVEQGDVQLQHNLGLLYQQGKDVDRDYHKAIYWWRKAAEAGFAQSQYNLGLMYAQGNGVEVDKAKAADLHRRAAEQGLVEAQYALGLAYVLGDGVPLDYAEAYQLFELAGKQGSASAHYNLGVLTESGNGTTADINEAIYWYRRAANQGFELAQEKLVKLEQQHGKLDEKHPAAGPIYEQIKKQNASDSGDIHDQSWIKNQSASHYTIQINFSHDKEGLICWLKSLQPLAPLAYYSQQLDGKVAYKALYGSFADEETARKAFNELPAELVELKPWLRRFSDIHMQIPDN